MKTAAAILLASVLFGTATTVSADPVTVTSGSIDHDSDFGPSGGIIYLTADSVFDLHSLFVTMDPLPGTVPPYLQPGQTVAFDTRITGFSQAFTGNQAQGELQFTSTPVTLPATVSLQDVVLRTPFSMTGFLTTETLSGSPAFAGDVVGSGSLVVVLRALSNAPTPSFFLDGAEFAFAAPAATPEPATAVLLGMTMVGALARRRRRP